MALEDFVTCSRIPSLLSISSLLSNTVNVSDLHGKYKLVNKTEMQESLIN